MKPGRELDALIAEKIMGWTKNITLDFYPTYYPSRPAQMNILGHIIPSYSTDIAAAWKVVEKLQSYNPFWESSDAFLGFELSPSIGINGKHNWYCNFGDSTKGKYADTVSHAICLAALKIIAIDNLEV